MVRPDYAIQETTMEATHTAETLPTLHITERDLARLREVVDEHIDGRLAEAADVLDRELERALVVPADRIASDVVTMRSRVVVEDVDTAKRRDLVLSYPREADIAEGKVSVLAPVGLALLGLRVGDTIRWPMPRGRHAELRLVAVDYQPEAAGQYDL
jgi:regulator of nucleoside diphosphate kinase